jgi:ornithine cyclodeaminase/alanine dehydrogenase-like protein (mu-crystallin family)
VTGIRIVAAEELRAHVQYEDLIEPVSRAFQASSAGRAENGLVVMFPGDSPASGDVYVKTGTLRGSRIYIVKVSPWFAINVERGDPQAGFIGVFDTRTGQTLALLDEQHYLSDIRTAAAGSLAARVLAPMSARTAAVLGAGVQAYWQPQALYRERPFEVLLIWARDPEKALRLKQRLSGLLHRVDIRVITDIEEAVRRCDVLMTATLAREPIVRGEWLRPGQHITAVGADDVTKCELDSAALRRARVFVDSLDANASNGDVGRAIASGRYARSEVSGELG